MAKTIHCGTLAIDPGILNCGWAFRTPGGFIHHGTVVTDSRDSVFFRIGEVLEELEPFLKRAEVVVIEDFLGRLGRSTVMLIGALGGVASAARANQVHKIPNRTWAPEFSGEKEKEKVKAATMRRVCEAGQNPTTQHAADAIGLLWYWESKNGGEADGDTKLKKRYDEGEYKPTGALRKSDHEHELLRARVQIWRKKIRNKNRLTRKAARKPAAADNVP